MPLQRYGVVKGFVRSVAYDRDDRPHLHVLVQAGDTSFDIAINVKSIAANSHQNQALFLIDENFRHPATDRIQQLDLGFTRLDYERQSFALDYIRGNLFQPDQLEPVPAEENGDDNDLFAKLGFYIHRAIQHPHMLLYAFGEPWYAQRSNSRFGFTPDRGVHEIHMNQGNDRNHHSDDGVWQDGAILLHDTRKDWWTAIFIAFETQSWHTDDQTGHTIPERAKQAGSRYQTDDPSVRIAAITSHPVDGRAEEVFLFNTTPDHMAVDSWSLMDGDKNREQLDGFIAGNSVRRIQLSGQGAQLPDAGGQLTLLNEDGHKVHGVVYTRPKEKGQTLVLGAHGTRLS